MKILKAAGLAMILLGSVTLPHVANASGIGRFMPPGLPVPPWLIIGLYEGTIPPSALSDMGYGDFDWAGMSPGQRTALYSAAKEAEENW